MKLSLNIINWAAFLEQIDKENLSKVKANSKWILPQLMALLNKLPLTTSDDLVSPKLTFQHWGRILDADGLTLEDGTVVNKNMLAGMLKVLTYHPRGDILFPSQSSAEGLRWSSGVPLVLSAFKELRDVKYSDWDWSDFVMSILVGEKMLECVEYMPTATFSKEDLIALREQGRVFKSGARIGTKRTLTATTSISSTDNPEFDALPSLCKVMLCQTWIFQPSLRHKLMICGPDLDVPPEPLETTEVFHKETSTSQLNLSDLW